MQQRVVNLEARAKDQEILIGDLKNKLSAKKLRQEQELKMAEERVTRLEKKMKEYEAMIKERDDYIRG